MKKEKFYMCGISAEGCGGVFGTGALTDNGWGLAREYSCPIFSSYSANF